MKRKPKYLTKFCQICRGFSHQTNCWLQEKNKEHCLQAWKGQLVQEMIEAAEEAVDEAMRRCEGNGDKEGTVD